MNNFKVYFICVLLVLSVAAQKKNENKNKKAAGGKAKPAGGTQTRGHFGHFGQTSGLGVGGGAYNPGVGAGGHFGGGYNPNVGVGVGPGGFGNVGVGGFRPGHGGGLGGIHGGVHPGVGVGVGGVHPGVGVGVGGIPPGLGGGQAPPSQCRYWCKTPEGQAYCCESENTRPKDPITTQIVNRGNCPPVRAVCPLRSFSPPFTCSKDGDCSAFTDKCCFDRCLGEHVCKRAQQNYYG